MSADNKYVFLDFDGVLFDTLREAYILCRYAYSGVNYFEPIDEDFYKKFYRYKFLVYNSWQYYYMMMLLNQGLTDGEFIKKYQFYMKKRDLSAEENFDKNYYYARNDLMANHHEFWDKLEVPFEFFYEIKRCVPTKLVPIIVSKKNKSAIEYRLNQYGLSISSDDIYGKDELFGYNAKAEFISEYMRLNGIKTAYFVDDNSHNLTPCKSYPQIVPILAGWGNVGINEVGLNSNEVINKILSD